MENTKKITKKEVFIAMLEIEGIKNSKIFVDFINHELELLNKKSTSKSVSKADQEKKAENETLKQEIVDTLINNGTCSIADLREKSEMLFPLSSSKISALLTQLRSAGLVNREYDKKTAVFSIA